jgi:hypothetical protein
VIIPLPSLIADRRPHRAHQATGSPLRQAEPLLHEGRRRPLLRRPPVFSEKFLQGLIIERLLGHQPLEPGVLFLQRLQPPQVLPFQAVVRVSPAIEGLFTDAVPPAERARRLPRGVLLQDADDLVLAES